MSESTPSFLQDLIRPTPSSVTKLIAAWDDLSVETQIALVSQLAESSRPQYLRERFWAKALRSKNAYVRYLVAKSIHVNDNSSEELIAAKEAIETDPVPLVRHATQETDWWLTPPWSSPEEFFEYPHEKRLALVRDLEGRGSLVAALIEYAIETGLNEKTVSEVEIYEILADYIQSEKLQKDFRERDLDGWHEYQKGQDLDALWALVPKLPEGLSHILLEHLPIDTGLSGSPDSETLEGLSKRQWNALLFRDDVLLSDWRKKFFFDRSDKEVEDIRFAAVSRNLRLSNEEFESVVDLREEERRPLIKILAEVASDLRLYQYEILGDLLSDTSSDDWEAGWRAKEVLEYKLSEAYNDPEKWEDQIRELDLYRLAKRLAKHGDSRADNMPAISDAIVEGDSWKTFTNLSRLTDWRSRKNLENLLPSRGDREDI